MVPLIIIKESPWEFAEEDVQSFNRCPSSGGVQLKTLGAKCWVLSIL